MKLPLEDAGLLAVLRDHDHYLYCCCWELLRSQVLTALRFSEQPDELADDILIQLRCDLAGYTFRGRLATWLTTRIAWHARRGAQ